MKRPILSGGKRYIVNCVSWDEGIGPGGPVGTLWLQSTDGSWYAVNVS